MLDDADNVPSFFCDIFVKKFFVLHFFLQIEAKDFKTLSWFLSRNKKLMFRKAFHIIGLTLLLGSLVSESYALTDKFRIMWRENPATTMVIGWNQVSGSDPILYIDVLDHGQNVEEYATVKKPNRVVEAKGMNNHYVRLWGLKPNTTYYFLIKDSEGHSPRMSFKTAPDNREERLSIIAGGDSRNNRVARQNANRLVGKLRPHCVMFGGDMTASDNGEQWQAWFDDWQLTRGSDGRMTPIIVARGNHESENKSLVDLFDVKNEDLYYALTLGGDLLRIYTLNSLMPAGGYQKDWLIRDLQAHPNIIWKFAQYHHSIRPHTEKKPEQHDQQIHWAPAFFRFGVNLVVESDAHVVKSTWPIRPCRPRTPGSDEGYIRDDEKGTVYIGEGCWGAPLRSNNDDKAWTRHSGSFNQFKWIFVGDSGIEVRTIVSDQSGDCAEVPDYDIFTPPVGLKIWEPQGDDVIRITRKRRKPLLDLPVEAEPEILAENTKDPDPIVENEMESTYESEPQRNTSSVVLDARVGHSMSIFDFKVFRSGDDVAIKWKTRNENSGMQYEIQRSVGTDANFKTICKVDGKAEEENDYFYMDKGFAKNNPGTRVNYRLKHTTPSGYSKYYDLKESKQKKEDWNDYPKLEPDASTNDVVFSYDLPNYADVSILILNEHRQPVKRINFRGEQSGHYTKRVNTAEISPGQYLLIVKGGKNVLEKFMVLKK